MNWYKTAQTEYPIAGPIVDGLQVTDNIPNTASIRASFINYEVLNGIRELPFDDFDGPKSVFYATDDFDRSKKLEKAINQSGQIDPLIIAIDDEGPYILEGAHRFVALISLGKKTFPALVVVDKDDDLV